jgi:hypothetical protein
MIALSAGIIAAPVGLAMAPVLIPFISIAFAVAFATGRV